MDWRRCGQVELIVSQSLFGDETTANPYDYGHLPEVFVRSDGTGTIKKHYCLGRISHEVVQVMPDERTVLMGDDATNSGLFMFVANRPRDLSAGKLYVAQWTQTSSAGPGAGKNSANPDKIANPDNLQREVQRCGRLPRDRGPRRTLTLPSSSSPAADRRS
jgi:uncharacterized protein